MQLERLGDLCFKQIEIVKPYVPDVYTTNIGGVD